MSKSKIIKIIVPLVGAFVLGVIVLVIVVAHKLDASYEIPLNYPEPPVDTHLSIDGNEFYFGKNMDSLIIGKPHWTQETNKGRYDVQSYTAYYSFRPSQHVLSALEEDDIVSLTLDGKDRSLQHIRILPNNLPDNVDFRIGDYRVTNESTIEDIGKALNRDLSDMYNLSDKRVRLHVRDVYLQIYYDDDGKFIIMEDYIPVDKPETYQEADTSGVYYDSPKYNVISMFFDKYDLKSFNKYIQEQSPYYTVEGRTISFIQDGKPYFEYSTNSKGDKDFNKIIDAEHFIVQDLPDDKIYKIGTYIVTNKTTFDDLKVLFGKTGRVRDASVRSMKGNIRNTYYFVTLLDNGDIDIKSW